MEIPQNPNTRNYEAEAITETINQLQKHRSANLYQSVIKNEELARKVGRQFKEKGYYVKINFFPNGSVQQLCIQEQPFDYRLQGRLITSIEL